MEAITRAAESTHWYQRNGAPCYEVMSAKPGVMRPATLRDARKLNLVPSVTTIIQCAAKPGLERWKAEQVMLSALTLPRREGENEKDWIARVWDDSQEQSRKARDKGTEIHAAIQGAYEGKDVSTPFIEYVAGAERAVAAWMKGPWNAEKSFACPLGFGGKVDLSHNWAVIDFKSKEFDVTADLKIWPEHAMQLAAYRHGLGMDKAKCAIVYVSVTNPGLAKLIEIPEEELQRGWKCFYSLLHYWQAKSGYTSAFDKLAA